MARSSIVLGSVGRVCTVTMSDTLEATAAIESIMSCSREHFDFELCIFALAAGTIVSMETCRTIDTIFIFTWKLGGMDENNYNRQRVRLETNEIVLT